MYFNLFVSQKEFASSGLLRPCNARASSPLPSRLHTTRGENRRVDQFSMCSVEVGYRRLAAAITITADGDTCVVHVKKPTVNLRLRLAETCLTQTLRGATLSRSITQRRTHIYEKKKRRQQASCGKPSCESRPQMRTR